MGTRTSGEPAMGVDSNAAHRSTPTDDETVDHPDRNLSALAVESSELEASEGAILLRRIDSRAPGYTSPLGASQLKMRLAGEPTRSASRRQPVEASLSVPVVSIEGAEVESSEANSRTERLGRDQRRRRRRELSRCASGDALQVLGGAGGGVPSGGLSSSSRASTTSEVNSNDDAASIASRLSQLVSEQEFQLSQQPEHHKSAGSLAPNSSTHNAAKLKQARSTVDMRAIGSLNESPGQKPSEPLDCAELAPHLRPERGDLKTLEWRRRSCRESQSVVARQRSNSLERCGQPMVNIQRSAWTLDEFEQTFKPPPPPPGPETISDLDSLGSWKDEPRLGSPGVGRRGELLMRASRNAHSLNQSTQQQQQQQQQHSQVSQLLHPTSHRPHSQLSSNLTVGANPFGLSKGKNIGAGGDPRRPSVELMPRLDGRRPSRTLSIGSSIASSVDSCRSARPFSGLGSLFLGPSQTRERRRHLHHAQPNGGGAATGYGGKSSLASGSNMDHDVERDSGCAANSWALLKRCLPIFDWLPSYKCHFLWGDLTAGMAVAVLNISTSLSAAVVAQTELGAAFRSSIVNTFVYALLCSSRHTSFGSWSIMSQMLLDSVRRALGDELILNRIALGPQASWTQEEYEMWHMNIIIMYTFLIGLVQLLAGLLNLGNLLASFIPEALCSSMIAATAFTMAVGQLANMAGTTNKLLSALERNQTADLAWADLKSSRRDITDLFGGLFRWLKQIALLVKHYDQVNVVCVVISIACVALLVVSQSFLQARLQRLFKRENLFVPSELILLVAMIAVSRALNLKEAPYSVPTCGPISLALGLPNVPNLRLIRELWFDSIATALISYTMVFIMAKTYSNKLNYEVDANQELIACGAGNLVGGLFDALPATASFSRTAGQVEAGGRTQMASLVNCLLLFVIAHWLGHHVAHLPTCVMAATLFYGFVRMLRRTSEALLYWRLCKVDFAIWIVTYVAILTLDLVNGFVYGFIFSILTMLYRAQNRRCYLLGSIGSSDVYVPLAKYPVARELERVKIFQFCGPIHYVSADLYERLLRQKTRVNVKQILQQRLQAQVELMQQQQHTEEGKRSAVKTVSTQVQALESVGLSAANSAQLPTHIILDFSMISFIDSAGLHVIKKIIADYDRVGITVMLASLASHVAAVVKSEPSLWDVHKDRFYVTIADAVHHKLRRNSRSHTNGADQQVEQ